MSGRNLAEKHCAISGIGQSDVGRRLGRPPLELTLDACYAAVADAGLTPADINGLATYPGGMAVPKGFTGASAYEVLDAMRLEVDWYDSGVETSGQLGSVMKACMAVATGMADHVLCFRSVWEGSAQGSGGRSSLGPGGSGGGRNGKIFAGDYQQWTLPFGSAGAPIWVALFAQAHMDRYGTTPEQLAQIALNGAAQRGAQSQGGVPGPDVARGLLRLADDHDALAALRLRRAVRRGDGLRRLTPRAGRGPGAATCLHRGDGGGDPRPPELGPTPGHHPERRDRRRGPDVGPDLAHAGGRRHGADLRRVQLLDDALARSAAAL